MSTHRLLIHTLCVCVICLILFYDCTVFIITLCLKQSLLYIVHLYIVLGSSNLNIHMKLLFFQYYFQQSTSIYVPMSQANYHLLYRIACIFRCVKLLFFLSKIVFRKFHSCKQPRTRSMPTHIIVS